MKVVCSGYKFCEYRHKCHHSTPHNILSDSISGTTGFFSGASKCELINTTNCKCSAIYLRKEKLMKINYESNL